MALKKELKVTLNDPFDTVEDFKVSIDLTEDEITEELHKRYGVNGWLVYK